MYRVKFSDMRSMMSERGKKEMDMLIRWCNYAFVFFVVGAIASVIIGLTDGAVMFGFGILMTILLPILLYKLDTLEQKHPALYPYFNFMDRFRKNARAQISIMGILACFFSLVVFAALLPTIRVIIDDALPHLNATETMMIQLVPLSILIAILASIYYYTQAR